MQAYPALESYLSRLEGECLLYVSVVVEGEVRFGIARLARGRKRKKLASALDSVLSTLESVLPVSRETARVYSDLKADLWRRGMPMGENDLWIAASALEHGLVLVTSDGLFQNVPGLKLEDWRQA
jgi:tRNA(fMet)-specific endonuclease VapC